MGRKEWLGVVGLALLALAPSVASAQGRLVINRAEVDEIAGTITITGEEFGAGAPEVTLDGVPVSVLSHTPTEVVIGLPAGTTPGTYAVTVAQPLLGRLWQDAFIVTVGEEGPQGPQSSPARRSARPPSAERSASTSSPATGTRSPAHHWSPSAAACSRTPRPRTRG